MSKFKYASQILDSYLQLPNQFRISITDLVETGSLRPSEEFKVITVETEDQPGQTTLLRLLEQTPRAARTDVHPRNRVRVTVATADVLRGLLFGHDFRNQAIDGGYDCTGNLTRDGFQRMAKSLIHQLFE